MANCWSAEPGNRQSGSTLRSLQEISSTSRKFRSQGLDDGGGGRTDDGTEIQDNKQLGYNVPSRPSASSFLVLVTNVILQFDSVEAMKYAIKFFLVILFLSRRCHPPLWRQLPSFSSREHINL